MPRSEQVPLYCVVPHPLLDPSQVNSGQGSGPNGLDRPGMLNNRQYLSHEKTDLQLTEDETFGRIESGWFRSDQIRSDQRGSDVRPATNKT